MARLRRMPVKFDSTPPIENAPHYSPRNNDDFVRPEREFRDHEHWMEMFSVRLGRYHAPTGPCQILQMERWLDRLGMETNDYEKIFNTSPQDFIVMNPGWPLFAWLGTVMEQMEIKT